MVGFILMVYLCLLLVFNYSPIKSTLLELFTERLQEELGTELVIRDFEIGLFNRVTLKDVAIYDQNHDVLLKSDIISVKVQLRDFFYGKIFLRTILLLEPEVNLYSQAVNAPYNYQFILDRFSSDEENSTEFNLKIGSLIITRGKVSFHQNWKEKTPFVFNPAHISIDQLHANMSLHHLTNDSINFRIRSLKGEDVSGLKINNVAIQLIVDSTCIEAKNFQFESPLTYLHSSELFKVRGDINNLKNNFNNLQGEGTIKIDKINPIDFIVFAPFLNKFPNNYKGILNFEINNDSLKTDLELIKEGNQSLIKLQNLALLSNNKIQQFHTNINEFELDSSLVNQIATATNLPNYLFNIGHIQSKIYAKVDLQHQQLITQIALNNSNIGNVVINSETQNNTTILEATVLNNQTAKILNQPSLPQNLSVSLQLRNEGNFNDLNDLHASLKVLEAQMPLHTIKDLHCSVRKQATNVKTDICCSDSVLNLTLSAKAQLQNESLTNIEVIGDIENINFHKLGINDSILRGDWSGDLRLVSKNWDDQSKDIDLRIDSFAIHSDGQDRKVNNITLQSEIIDNQLRNIILKSDFLTLQADGNSSLESILTSCKHAIFTHIPCIENQSEYSQDHFRLYLNGRYHNLLEHFLGTSLSLRGTYNAEGHINHNNKLFEFSANVDTLDYDQQLFNDVRLHSLSDSNQAKLRVQFEKELMNELVRVELNSHLSNDSLYNNLLWKDNNLKKFAGEIKLNSNFNYNQDKLKCETVLSPTSFIINEKLWTINQGKISIADSYTQIDSICVQNSSDANLVQQISCTGNLSQKEHQIINLELQNLDVGYILDLIKFDDVLFDGYASGVVKLSPNSELPILQSELKVRDFCFNNALLGDADISAQWNQSDLPINVLADIKNETNNAATQINGYISPAEKGLDLNIETTKMNLAFLNMWVNGIVNQVEGDASGVCKLYGPFKKLDLEGKINVNASITVPSNGVRYTIHQGKVNISSGRFHLTEGTITDKNFGKGTIQATLDHTKLKKFRYNLNVQSENLLLYDINDASNMPFYANACGNGNIQLTGKPGEMSLDVNISPVNNSLLVYTGHVTNLYDSDSGNDYITFRNIEEKHQADSQSTTTQNVKVIAPGMDMRLNFKLNMNPSATLRVIMDENNGSYIDLKGNGMLNAAYHNKGAFTLYGDYSIEGGTYRMNIENFVKKNFEIQSGGSIKFNGNTDYSPIDIKAIYTVPTASISDLNIGENFNDKKVPVNCILNISGTPIAPIVNFELDLPTVSEDEKRMVRSLIATEDDLNMQIIHLLGFGRFYTYDYNKVVTDAQYQNQSTVMANSFISSTLSSQFNDAITRVLNTKNWNIGTNLSTGTYGWDDMEVEGLFSGRLMNNRLQFTGNIGYHENKYKVTNNTNFVGDFDFTYLLNPAGTYQIKGYSQSNNRYFTKSTLTTQGVGIKYQRDFNNIKELFKFKK